MGENGCRPAHYLPTIALPVRSPWVVDTELAGPEGLLEGCPHACSQASVVHGRVQGRGYASCDRFRPHDHRSGPGAGAQRRFLSTWVKDERRRIAVGEVRGKKPLDAAERAELLRLRRQVTELEKDNAFLVKASAYFAAMQKNPNGSI